MKTVYARNSLARIETVRSQWNTGSIESAGDNCVVLLVELEDDVIANVGLDVRWAEGKGTGATDDDLDVLGGSG